MKGQKPLPGSAATEHAALGSPGLMKHFQHCDYCGQPWSRCIRTLACVEHVCVWVCVDSSELPSEWAAVVLELKNRPRPKSPSFTTPVAVMNTLAGLISDKRRGRLERKVTKTTTWGTEMLTSESLSLMVEILIEGVRNQSVFGCLFPLIFFFFEMQCQCNYKWILNRHPVKWPLKLRGH